MDMLYKILCFIFYLLVINVANADVGMAVKTAKVIRNEVFQTISAVGNCRNELSKVYLATTPGTVEFVSTKQGQPIKAGEVILIIDQQIAESLKRTAETAFQASQDNFNRDKALHAKGLTTKEELQNSAVALENANRELATSLKQYNDMFITAPFDGYVGTVKVRVGQRVNPNDYLVEFVGNSSKSVLVELPSNLLDSIDHNTKAVVYDLKGQKIEAQVSSVANYLSPNGTFLVKLIVNENLGQSLVHGSYVKSEFEIDRHPALLIPEECVSKNENGNFVYVVMEDNIAKQLYVNVGIRMQNLIEITSDVIKIGDMVVTEGLTKIRDGSLVEILNKD